MDFQQLLTDKTTEMEELLTRRFGARRRNLGDKFKEVREKLVGFGFEEKKFLDIKQIRNNYAHVHKYEYNGNKEFILSDCNDVIEQLRGIDPLAYLHKQAAVVIDQAVNIAPPNGKHSSYENWASQKELKPSGDLYRLPDAPSIEERKLLLSNQAAMAVDIYEPDRRAKVLRLVKITAYVAGAILVAIALYFAVTWLIASRPKDIFAKSEIDSSIPPKETSDPPQNKQMSRDQYTGEYQLGKHKFVVATRKGKFVIESVKSRCELEESEDGDDEEFDCVRSTTAFKGKILFVKDTAGNIAALKIIPFQTKPENATAALKVK